LIISTTIAKAFSTVTVKSRKRLIKTKRFALGAMFDYQLALLYRFENQLPLCIGLKAFLKAAWAFMTKPHLNRVQPSRTWFEKEVKEQRLGFTDLVFVKFNNE